MARLKHLLLINHEFPPIGGGAATASAEIAEALALSGLKITVLTSSYGNLPRGEKRNGYRILRIPSLRKRADRSNVFEMLSFLLSSLWWVSRRGGWLDVDACIAFFGIPAGPAAWLLKKTAGVPFIISLRGGDVPGFLPEALRLWHVLSGGIIRFLWRNAAFVVANSKGLASLARSSAPKLEVAIIPNGVAVFDPVGKQVLPAQSNGRPLRLISVGRLHVQKNYPCLLEALSQTTHTDWQLEIIGDGPERGALENMAARLGIAAKVTFCGWMDRNDLLRRLADADIFVFPSIQEGMPNAVLEAMAMGLPVIACRIEGCEEVVVHGETGFLVSPDNSVAFGEALAQLLHDPDMRKRFGENGRTRVRETYTWKAVASGYAELCEVALRQQ